ncbi:MAG: hypothetical protein ACYC99_13145 [Candidatus Geothermincolia bacterium]
MLEEKLVEIIEQNSDNIALAWYREAINSVYMPNLKNLTQQEALRIAQNVYSKLSHWLQPGKHEEIQAEYEHFGEMCYSKGFRMEEVVQSLVLIKRYLWLHLLERGIMTTNIEVYQALDVNNKVVLYFDRAIYFGLIGFKSARAADLRSA